MTVKQKKNERKIFAPHYKNGLNKKLIIKDLKNAKFLFDFYSHP